MPIAVASHETDPHVRLVNVSYVNPRETCPNHFRIPFSIKFRGCHASDTRIIYGARR